jgi:hypothetical protein
MSDEQAATERYLDTARALTSTLHMSPQRAVEMERDLSRAFAEYRPATAPVVAAPRSSLRWPWMAAAAAILMIATAAALWPPSGGITADHITDTSAAAAKEVLLPPNAAATQQKPLVEAGAGQPGPSRSRAAAARPHAAVRASRSRPASTADAARIIRPGGFVAVPAAADLPRFESGTIVRVELPVSELPGYGVDISPAAGDGPVEADVLVGQDGQPRAIRLVTNNSRSSQ